MLGLAGLVALAVVVGACGGDAASTEGLSDAAEHGQQLARTQGCTACHGAAGEGGVGPAWTGVLGSTVTLNDGTEVVVDEAYLTRAIADPDAEVVAGFSVAMPESSLDDADVADLVAYIVALKDRGMRRLLAAATVALLLSACGGDDQHELVGLTRDPEPQVDGTPLPDVADGGAPFALRAPPGGLLLVYFGYTNCPDVCPTTLSDVKVALADLGADAERVSLAMITVDPARDEPVLAEYVRSFVPDAHALATDDAATLQAVAGPFGVVYLVTTTPTGDVEVAHSSYLFAVDDAGKLVLTWPVGVDAETSTSAKELAADVDALLDDAASES